MTTESNGCAIADTESGPGGWSQKIQGRFAALKSHGIAIAQPGNELRLETEHPGGQHRCGSCPVDLGQNVSSGERAALEAGVRRVAQVAGKPAPREEVDERLVSGNDVSGCGCGVDHARRPEELGPFRQIVADETAVFLHEPGGDEQAHRRRNRQPAAPAKAAGGERQRRSCGEGVCGRHEDEVMIIERPQVQRERRGGRNECRQRPGAAGATRDQECDAPRQHEPRERSPPFEEVTDAVDVDADGGVPLCALVVGDDALVELVQRAEMDEQEEQHDCGATGRCREQHASPGAGRERDGHERHRVRRREELHGDGEGEDSPSSSRPGGVRLVLNRNCDERESEQSERNRGHVCGDSRGHRREGRPDHQEGGGRQARGGAVQSRRAGVRSENANQGEQDEREADPLERIAEGGRRRAEQPVETGRLNSRRGPRRGAGRGAARRDCRDTRPRRSSCVSRARAGRRARRRVSGRSLPRPASARSRSVSPLGRDEVAEQEDVALLGVVLPVRGHADPVRQTPARASRRGTSPRAVASGVIASSH